MVQVKQCGKVVGEISVRRKTLHPGERCVEYKTDFIFNFFFNQKHRNII